LLEIGIGIAIESLRSEDESLAGTSIAAPRHRRMLVDSIGDRKSDLDPGPDPDSDPDE
jgi:hypothetical protein